MLICPATQVCIDSTPDYCVGSLLLPLLASILLLFGRLLLPPVFEFIPFLFLGTAPSRTTTVIILAIAFAIILLLFTLIFLLFMMIAIAGSGQ